MIVLRNGRTMAKTTLRGVAVMTRVQGGAESARTGALTKIPDLPAGDVTRVAVELVRAAAIALWTNGTNQVVNPEYLDAHLRAVTSRATGNKENL
jgi:hypothetical protein